MIINEKQLHKLAADFASGKNRDLVDYVHDKVKTAIIANMETMTKLINDDYEENEEENDVTIIS